MSGIWGFLSFTFNENRCIENPTIFTGVTQAHRIAREEIFGPVLAVIKARDWKHALKIANNTQYGLTGAVYTQKATLKQ